MQPFPDIFTQAGQRLRQVLVRLNEYAKGRAAKLDPASKYAAQQKAHLDDISALFRAVGEYEQAATTCLTERSEAIASAAPKPADEVPTLEQAILGQLSPPELRAYRLTDPVYRLGCVRGYRSGVADTTRTCERLVGLYAQHAVLPPAVHPADSVVYRAQRHLASPSMQAYAALPLATRQALNNLTPGQWNALIERQLAERNGTH